MNDLKIFEHPKFGKIRTIVEDGKTLFCGLDAAKALGYKDTTNAIKQHCRWVVKRHLPHPQNPSKTIEMNFIPEGDLCRLAAKSELPGANLRAGFSMKSSRPSCGQVHIPFPPHHRIGLWKFLPGVWQS